MDSTVQLVVQFPVALPIGVLYFSYDNRLMSLEYSRAAVYSNNRRIEMIEQMDGLLLIYKLLSVQIACTL